MSHFFFSYEQLNKPIDVVFVENALVDLLVRATDQQLGAFSMTKGVMQLVDAPAQKAVLDQLHTVSPEIELGGSAANAARGMALLGARAVYSSCISDDTYGRLFGSRLEQLGIQNRLSFCTQGKPTGTCLVVVTPDNERTLNTHLGACRSYMPQDLPFEDLKQAKVFFSTGYMLDTQNQIDALHAAMDWAALHNAKVAFDVADPFVIMRHGSETLLKLLEKAHIVFANAQEAQMLLGCQGAAAAQALSKLVAIAVVKDGANGAYLAHDEKVTHIPAPAVQVVDTTGAGDMYAAGFLYGLCRGLGLDICGQIATMLGSDTVTHLGARLSPTLKDHVEDLLRYVKTS